MGNDILSEQVKIDPLNLQDDFVTLPSHFSYVANQYQAALRSAMVAERERKKLEKVLYIEHRERARQAGEKLTEATLSAMVDTDARLEQAIDAEIDAEVNKERLKLQLEALRLKRDMLIQTGAAVRQEMAADPSLRQR